MIITLIGERFAVDGTGMGLPVSPRFTKAIEWNGAELPQVGDAIEGPGVTWRVVGREWAWDHTITLHVQERQKP